MYDKLGSHSCRKAVMKDLPAMYTLIESHITEESEHRKLYKHIKYYIKQKSACVVENSNNEVIGFYAGKDNFIHFFICKGGPIATLFLFYTVLCGIHNRYECSYFEIFDSNRNIFGNLNTPVGKGCIIDEETGKGKVTPETKKYIEQQYRRFKDE